MNGLPGWAGKAIFGVVAVVMVALGAWVMTGGDTSAGTKPAPAPVAVTDNGKVVPNTAIVVPRTKPGRTGTGDTPVGSNALGNLTLPVSTQGLTDAAALAVKVTAGMNTYAWNEDPKAWLAKLTVLVSDDAVHAVAEALPVGTVRNQYAAQKILATANATVVKVRMVGEGQVMFTVTVTQVSTGTTGAHTTKASYWVSVNTTRSRVTSVQPSGTGNL